MALTLNATLQTQLDGNTRHPICKVVSESFANPIPFDGNSLALSNASNFRPDIARISTGQLAMVYESNASGSVFNVNITDITRSFWNQYTVSTGDGSVELYNVVICEMSDGNLLCSYAYLQSGTYNIKTWIIDTNGDDVSSSSNTVFTLADATYTYQDHYLLYDSEANLYYLFYTYATDATPTYTLAYRSSSDGITWGSENVITLTGISNTNIISNVHAFQSADNDIILSFQYEYDTDPVSGWVTYNVFYAVSDDNLATFATPTQVSSYTAFGQSGIQPQVEIKDDGNVYFVFVENIGVSYFDDTTPGVLTDISNVWPIHVHLYNNLLYVVSANAGTGTKELGGMYVIDPTDMSIVTQYTQTTSPGFTASFWSANHVGAFQLNSSAGKYMAAASLDYSSGSNIGVIALATYDGVTDTTEEYVFNGDLGAHGLVENVTVDLHEDDYPVFYKFEVRGCAIDEANDRLYVLLCINTGTYAMLIGYIDLTESKDPISGKYTWNEVYYSLASDITDAYGLNNAQYDPCFGFNTSFFGYMPSNDLLVHCGFSSIGDDYYAVAIISASGQIQDVKAYDIDSRFPRFGPNRAWIYDNIMYADFVYTGLYNQEDFYGMMIWDMVTDTVRYDRPTYATQDEYTIYDMDFNDIGNGYIFLGMADGAVRYNIGTRYFELWDKDNTPGFGGNDSIANQINDVDTITFDTVNNDVFAGGGESVSKWAGVRKFNVNGYYYIGQYAIGTKVTTDLGLGAINDFTVPEMETHISLVSDAANVLWAFWDHYDSVNQVYDIYWGIDLGSIDISSDLPLGSSVQIVWDLEYPATLSFSVARGHLYDPHNALSTLNFALVRGRKITVQFGELISSVEYFQNQGTFVVEEGQLSYVKGNHPVMNVSCTTIQNIWQEHTLVATDYYDGQSPKNIVDDLLSTWSVLTAAEYDITAFDDTHTIWNQWTDISFWDVIKAIMDHFGYIGYFDVDGVFINRKVDFTKAIDHTYSDNTQIIEFTPHSGYGSFVNGVRVIGETHELIEVLYEAEQVAQLNGTLGWWMETEVKKIYYSEDQTLMGRNPVLDPTISLADFQYLIFKGGGQEYISFVDPENLYCEVTLIGPNLIGVVVGLAAAAVTLGTTAIECSYDCGIYIMGTNLTLSLLIYALLAVANWAFNLFVQPIGEMRQTVQYLAQDTSFRDALNGQNVTEEIEDPLCYSVDQCERVAKYELNVAKFQRNRLKFRKLAHLQDEILDKMSIVHPFSNVSVELIATNITRSLVIGGEMTDNIEGWRVV